MLDGYVWNERTRKSHAKNARMGPAGKWRDSRGSRRPARVSRLLPVHALRPGSRTDGQATPVTSGFRARWQRQRAGEAVSWGGSRHTELAADVSLGRWKSLRGGPGTHGRVQRLRDAWDHVARTRFKPGGFTEPPALHTDPAPRVSRALGDTEDGPQAHGLWGQAPFQMGNRRPAAPDTPEGRLRVTRTPNPKGHRGRNPLSKDGAGFGVCRRQEEP